MFLYYGVKVVNYLGICKGNTHYFVNETLAAESLTLPNFCSDEKIRALTSQSRRARKFTVAKSNPNDCFLSLRNATKVGIFYLPTKSFIKFSFVTEISSS